MANIVSAYIKCGLLRYLARQAPFANQPLGDFLNTFQDSIVANGFVKGGVILGTSGGGHSVSLQGYIAGNQLNQDRILELTEFYIRVYQDAVHTLADQGNITPTDADILTTMLDDDAMKSVTGALIDTTGLRYLTAGPAR